VGLHDGLDVGELVSADEHESTPLGAHALILGRRQFEQLSTVEAGALAAKGHERVFLPRPESALDRLVHLAKRALVRGDAELDALVHREQRSG
jgi:hypothetical protein